MEKRRTAKSTEEFDRRFDDGELTLRKSWSKTSISLEQLLAWTVEP